MSKTLTEIAEQLKNTDKKVQLIYAFNGTGKTRLSREFKDLISLKNNDDKEQSESLHRKILYYNAFTEDLFYWDNDLRSDGDTEPKLKIQPNFFTNWILKDQGQDRNIVTNFQNYANAKLTPNFNEDFTEVTFTLERGGDDSSGKLKISKSEESYFIWSVFYTLLDQVISILDDSDLEISQFDDLEYVFIDDPMSSLDENHLIKLAVNLAELVKFAPSQLKFIITTHSPLFYNVLHNELKSDDKNLNYNTQKHYKKYRLEKKEDELFQLEKQPNGSPFSYHLHLLSELNAAIKSGHLKKYHFNFLRNILEKTAIFLGYEKWGDLLPITDDGTSDSYATRIINISSHSQHSGEEVAFLNDEDKQLLGYLVKNLTETCLHWQQTENNNG